MNQPQLAGNPEFSEASAGFAYRPPSQSWEQIRFASDPQSFLWAWFKPATAPQGLIVRIPDDAAQAQSLTLRTILHLAGVDPAWVAMWQVYGMAYPGMNGANPLLDQPIPAPVVGADPSILIYVAAPQPSFMPMPTMMMAPGTMPMMSPVSQAPTPVSGNTAEVLERLDIEWNAAMDVEKDLERLRKMLVDLMSRLKTLNRDLSPDERLYSSREDKQDWQDARRFLRDSDNRLRACVKEFDIGDPSSAGHKRYFEQIHAQFVTPRLPFEGMDQALNGFEFYRKLLTTLQGKMNSVFLSAQSNGERRAQMVLARIANKVREASNKKTALGVALDG